MHTHRTLVGLACRLAAISLLVAASASRTEAQQSAAAANRNAPILLASGAAPSNLASASGRSYSSSAPPTDADAFATERFDLRSAALAGSQPPPRRRYGRPNYADSHTNPDGSNKYTFFGGVGAAAPVGNTHEYETPSYSFQAGGGRNFNQSLGVMLEFDYDRFGLQGSTLNNQETVYNYGCTTAQQNAGNCSLITNLDGNNHVWSFTLDPTFTLATHGSLGGYAVVGGGYYHKVTNFQVPEVGQYCDYFYGCYQYQANQTIDHYTSNAGGVNAGFGVTFKPSRFANERLYIEARYVVIFNQQKVGLTASNVGTSFGASYTGYNFYPANSNRTTFIPITFGLRF